ncbi:glycosyltransferase family 1 protein [Micromonospora sp. WMMD882]|uniref:glycosyltransferase family protein n=1 Tax=Micromonospora sp. WMMD882 TaxID=3015151 RepID=UPI00248CFDF8|nr:glycosyltransferase [Micromonospora sp. WMMD882]WBB81622.1 glycosyltransferase family 1 protein [Micromonospora sp. WMMD882]
MSDKRPVARRLAARTVDGALARATAPGVLRRRAAERLWRQALTAPGLPDGVRVKLAERVHAGLVGAGRAASAASSASAVASRLDSAGLHARMLAGLTRAELDAGLTPSRLDETWRAGFAVADRLHQRGRVAHAARILARTMPLGFHRVLHFDQLDSPLSADPTGFLAPLRDSVAARALTAAGRDTPAADRPAGRPLRLLFATCANDNFLGEIRQRYADRPDVEVRFLDVAADPARRPMNGQIGRMVEHLLLGGTAYGTAVEEWLRPHLDWADTVFVDWSVSTAVLFTMVDPGDTRIVVRLHSFELWSLWPHLVTFGRVDDLVFVSEHLRQLGRAVLPGLDGPGGPRTHVLTNAMDLRRFVRPKSDEARFRLAVVGVGAIAKDPRWAVDVLRELRAVDPRYRLRLVGGLIDPAASPAAARYRALLDADLAELGDAVETPGQTSDVPGALTDIGVILSSSVRESFHCALVEGAASGAVPVVRDWPFFDRGARGLFPDGWVVDTPKEAAARILAATATDQRWREVGAEASAHALATWDWPVTRHGFDELFLG